MPNRFDPALYFQKNKSSLSNCLPTRNGFYGLAQSSALRTRTFTGTLSLHTQVPTSHVIHHTTHQSGLCMTSNHNPIARGESWELTSDKRQTVCPYDRPILQLPDANSSGTRGNIPIKSQSRSIILGALASLTDHHRGALITGL